MNILDPQHTEDTLRLDADGRYEYFLNHIIETGLVWALADEEGFAMSADEDGNTYLPLWPEAEFASRCANGDWAAYAPESIALDEFIEDWLPGLEKDKLGTELFATPEDSGVLSSAIELGVDIEAACEDDNE